MAKEFQKLCISLVNKEDEYNGVDLYERKMQIIKNKKVEKNVVAWMVLFKTQVLHFSEQLLP